MTFLSSSLLSRLAGVLKRHGHHLLLLLLLADLGYSFWQYLQFPLDGDLAPVVWPVENYRHVLHDPFGWRVLRDNAQYPGPNRFFAHYFLYAYFRHVPLWLQRVMSPVNSLYAACALIKISAHLLIVYVLAVAVSNRYHVLNKRLLLAAVLLTPFMQASGFHHQMGVVDWSITYTAFYALPTSWLLLFFLPFGRAALHGEPVRLSGAAYLGLLGLMVVLAFNSPIVPGTVLIVCPAVLLVGWYRRWAARPAAEPVLRRAGRALGEMPLALLLSFGLFIVLSLYSLFIGLNNSENQWATLPLAARYQRLGLGVYYHLSGALEERGKYGFALLLGALLLSTWLVRRQPPTPLRDRILTSLKWLAVFAAVYVLLLPLGGYRSYREYIIRRDTILPVTLGVMAGFAATASYLFAHLRGQPRRLYAGLVVLVLAVFTLADRQRADSSNACERALFAQLARSPAPVVRLPATCTMMDWQPLTDYHKSELNGQMLHYWHITETPKLYFQQ